MSFAAHRAVGLVHGPGGGTGGPVSGTVLRVVAFAPEQCGGTGDSASDTADRASPVPPTPPPALLLSNAGRDLDGAHEDDGGDGDHDETCDSGIGASRYLL